ncbi:M28 family metallopeptidase [Shewanella sp. YIC-542]|uniref:M28 family metallopeptidase n=1 Tax=Shewanella mytili TaxID=3377111 RepID=UPI00398E79B9
MRFVYSLCLLTLISGCSYQRQQPPATVQFDEQQYRRDIQQLSSDAFEGRAPTTHGEKMTLDYLVNAFKNMGMQPGPDGSYLQKVPMVNYTASEQQQVTLAGMPLQYRKDIVLNSRHGLKKIQIEQAPLVFVGYGINAPEYQWNDYQGLDMTGKIAIILVNDPGFAAPETGKFTGKIMTYYGRWTYKFEEASRQGALGAILIHQTDAASYPWSVVEHSWTGPQQDLATTSDTPRVQVEGWMSLASATAVFKQSGLKLQQLLHRAAREPLHIALKQNASIHFANHSTYADSYNVVATLPGQQRANEHVLFTGHWDHLGKDESLSGDKIFNGAMDNASGVAGMLALARQYSAQAKAGHPLQRSLTFIATTGEEQGLLGSRYYAQHPLYPLQNTIGVFNLDSTNIYGRTKDFIIVGKGKSELEQYLEAAVKRQQRRVVSERHPESGGYFRSDHFSFAQYGVPAAFSGGGSEPVDAATARYKAKMQQQMKGCYHNVCDQYHDNWDLGGALEDLAVYYHAAASLADSDDRPGYYQGTEFYPLRPASQHQH